MTAKSVMPPSLVILIIATLALAALNIAVFYLGFIASDDSLYNSYATQIATGNFTLPEKHWAFRYTVIFPLAGLIRVVGVSEQTTLILTLSYLALLLALLCWLTYRVSDALTAMWLGLLAATTPVLITLSSTLNADIPEAFFLLASISFFYFAWHHRAQSMGLFFMAGVSAGLAMLTRETAYGIGLFYAVYLVRYGIARPRPFLWLSLGTFAIIGLEMTTYAVIGESPFYRLISATQSHGGLNAAGAQFSAGSGNLSDSRIWGAPLALLFNQEFGLLFWLAIGCAIALRKHPGVGEQTRRFLSYAYLAGGIYFVWLGYSGTIRPLPRYFIFDLVLALIPIAVLINVTPKKWLKALIVMAAVGANYAGLSVDNINQRYPDRMIARFAMQHDGHLVADAETVSRAQSFLTLMGGERERLISWDGHLDARANFIAIVDGRVETDSPLMAVARRSELIERVAAPKLMVGKILDLTRLGQLLPPDKYWWLAVRTPDVLFYRVARE